MDPRRYNIDHILLRNLQERLDLEELDEDLTFNSKSAKSTESHEKPMHYYQERIDQPLEREKLEDNMHQDSEKSTEHQGTEREIKHEFQSYQDLKILKVGGYRGTTFGTWLSSRRSYDNLIKLRLTNCKNCRRTPTLGQLPALRSLTIETLQSVVAVGSELFKEDDCASLIPFPSLETLHFENMISWEEWHSIHIEAFPKLRTLPFKGCPKLIGILPPQLVSLHCLEIEECPLLASSIPNCPKIQELLIIKNQNVVLQEHIPPSMRRLLVTTDCQNLIRFVSNSQAPLVHLQRISICNCKFLRSLFDDMERLIPNLKELCISECPEMEPFSAGSLPSSLKLLEIINCEKLLSCDTDWRHLPTITKVQINTRSETLHCTGLQYLTLLQELEISYSPKLEKIKGGMMPPSLQRLLIWGCRLLEERCHNKDKEIWPKISHLPVNVLQTCMKARV